MQSAPPAAEPVDDLNFLRAWREPVTPRRIARDVVGSLSIHALILVLLLFLPDVALYKNSPEILANFKNPTILVAPRSLELTQKAPNRGKVLKELDVRSAVQEQPAQAPHVRQFNPPPGPPVRQPAPAALQTPQIEMPEIQTGPLSAQAPSLGAATPGLTVPTAIGGPPRQNPAAAPKAPQAPPLPNPIREALRSGGGGVTVGDISEDVPKVPGLTPSPCNDCSALQLLSDPKNIDFKPYLLQILAIVKRNWLSGLPESARQGRRGIVVVRFAIDGKGQVSEFEFSTSTGTDLDRGAVHGISASAPFPPLPAEYPGKQIRLQMAFAYNMVPR